MNQEIESSHKGYTDRSAYWEDWLKDKSVQDVIRQLELFESQAERDNLTGLYNRRGFLHFVEDGGKNRIKHIGYVDIDAFKQINDNYGHLAGDLVLKYVAKSLKEAVGEYGVVARWGGDEFVMGLTTEDPEVIAKIYKNCWDLVDRKHVSVTIGTRIWNGEEDLEMVLDRADTNMYQKRETRRNEY
jgi:diguanylate cyclase (GGDEF)-like protein